MERNVWPETQVLWRKDTQREKELDHFDPSLEIFKKKKKRHRTDIRFSCVRGSDWWKLSPPSFSSHLFIFYCDAQNPEAWLSWSTTGRQIYLPVGIVQNNSTGRMTHIQRQKSLGHRHLGSHGILLWQLYTSFPVWGGIFCFWVSWKCLLLATSTIPPSSSVHRFEKNPPRHRSWDEPDEGEGTFRITALPNYLFLSFCATLFNSIRTYKEEEALLFVSSLVDNYLDNQEGWMGHPYNSERVVHGTLKARMHT